MAAVFEWTTLEIRIASNPKVYAALEKSLPAAGGRLLGAFVADVGDLNRVMLLREFADGNALTEARRKLHLDGDALGCGEWLLGMHARSFALFPSMPAVLGGALGPCYEIRTYRVNQNMLPATLKAWNDRLPGRTALSPMVAGFTALDGDVPSIMHIWAYPDAATRAKTRADAIAKGIWPPLGGAECLATMNSMLCTPAPFSPLS